MNFDHWEQIMQVNFWSAFYRCYYAYPIMMKQKSGQIINTDSHAGLIPGGLSSSYSTAKHAVVGFSLNLRSEAKQYRIKAIDAAVDEFKELNSIILGNKLFIFEDIDINIPLELNTDGEKFPRQIVIRKADKKSAGDIFGETEAARRKFSELKTTGDEDSWADNMMKFRFYFQSLCVKRLSGKL